MFEMTVRRYVNLLKAANVKWDDLRIGYLTGPAVIDREERPLLVIFDEQHMDFFNQHIDEIERQFKE